MFKKTVATREKVNLMIGLSGPSGSGKTYSALQLGYGITGDWSKITLADTENKSALYYAGERTGPWNHIDFSPDTSQGYSPANWVALIDFVQKDGETEVLILDSISHEWAGVGGCLDISNKMKGNSFANWATITPMHVAFIDKMRNTNMHIIATCRSKNGYSLEKNEKTGKTTPEKIGLELVQRDGIEYEFGVWFDVSMSHMATTSKDRTGIITPRGPLVLNPDIGRDLINWSKSAVDVFTPDDAQMMDRISETIRRTGLVAYQEDIIKELTGQDFIKDTVAKIVTKYKGIRDAAEAKAREEAAKAEIEDEHGETPATPSHDRPDEFF